MKIYREGDTFIAEHMGYKLDTGARSFIDALAEGIRTMEPHLLETITK